MSTQLLSHLKGAALACAMAAACAPSMAGTMPLTFSSATQTYAQTSPGLWSASLAIDGNTTSTALPSGWAIANSPNCTTANSDGPGGTCSQSALFRLSSPIMASGETFIFNLFQNFSFIGQHTLDTFSLRYTTTNNPSLSSPGTLLTITQAVATNGVTLNLLNGGTLVDAAGLNPATSVYTLSAAINSPEAITGFFLDAVESVNSVNGPGRQPSNGNFVLTEFQVSVVSEPGSAALALLSAGLLGWSRRRKGSAAAFAG